MADPNNRYGLTAARTHGRPGREIRPLSLTVDIHSHVQVPAAAAYARPHQAPDPRASSYTEETRMLTRRQDDDWSIWRCGCATSMRWGWMRR
jgi:aminocarboxymuconate-semialdehyde decarboxylase